jgi:hypothetical protein
VALVALVRLHNVDATPLELQRRCSICIGKRTASMHMQQLCGFCVSVGAHHMCSTSSTCTTTSAANRQTLLVPCTMEAARGTNGGAPPSSLSSVPIVAALCSSMPAAVTGFWCIAGGCGDLSSLLSQVVVLLDRHQLAAGAAEVDAALLELDALAQLQVGGVCVLLHLRDCSSTEIALVRYICYTGCSEVSRPDTHYEQTT